jgi:hypothetical protein
MSLGTRHIDDVLTFYATTTRFDTGAGTDADSVPTYRVYEEETGTAILNGSMALLDSSNTAGYYSEQITLSAANGFEVGKCYSIFITATVNSVAGVTHREFVVRKKPLTATTEGRELDVTATGGAGVDWSNVEAPTTTLNLSGTTVKTATDVATIFTGITSLAQWLGLIAAKQVGNTTARTELNATGAGSGTYDETTDSLQGSGDADPTIQDLVDAILDEPLAGHADAGSVGEGISNASSAGDPWSTALPGAYGAGTAGKLLSDANVAVTSGTHGNAALKTLIDTLDDFVDGEIATILAAVDTEIAAIKAKTDPLTFTATNFLQSDVQYINATELTGNGAGTPWGPA